MKSIQDKIIIFVASGAGAGYVPFFPGTVATLIAIPLSIGLNYLAGYSLIAGGATLGGSIIASMALAGKASRLLGQKDPSIVVIDEIAGFLLANFLAPVKIIVLASSFLLFRFFDIAKVYPSRKLEALPGGAGIVLDDVMAGIYTLIIVQVLVSWELL